MKNIQNKFAIYVSECELENHWYTLSTCLLLTSEITELHQRAYLLLIASIKISTATNVDTNAITALWVATRYLMSTYIDIYISCA